MLTIREFNEQTDSDYKAGVAIWNANYPDYLETIEEWKSWHANRDTQHFYERLIGEINGEPVGYADWGESGWSDFPGKHNWDFYIHPDHDFELVAAQMYDHIIAKIMARKPTKISAGARSDKAQYVAFLESKAYTLTQTEPTSLLDVTAFDPMTFQASVNRAANAGIKMVSTAQAKEMDPNWKRKLYDLRWEIFQDIPMTDAPKPQPFEVFEKRMDDPIVTPLDTRYIAIDTTKATADDCGPYAAISDLSYNRVNKAKGHTGLTGVARAYRRQGIASAIKVHAITQAKADGIEIIDTDNDENNPMLDLNIRLGFKPGPAWLAYELIIE